VLEDVRVGGILNTVYPEDLAIQHDNVLNQSTRVINLSTELIKRAIPRMAPKTKFLPRMAPSN
jgi:hypothetical protein